MDKKLFAEVNRKAHKMAKEFKAKYSNINYHDQFRLCFKYIVAMIKRNAKIEAVKTIMQKGVKKTLYAMGQGITVKCCIVDLNNTPTNDLKQWFSIWKLPTFYITKLLA